MGTAAKTIPIVAATVALTELSMTEDAHTGEDITSQASVGQALAGWLFGKKKQSKTGRHDHSGVPIAGARALGGPVSQGKTYLVGERGPELFTPGLSGAISTHDVQRMLSRATFAPEGARGGSGTVHLAAPDLASAVTGRISSGRPTTRAATCSR